MLGQPSYRNPLKIPIDVYLAPDIILLQTGFGLNHSVWCVPLAGSWGCRMAGPAPLRCSITLPTFLFVFPLSSRWKKLELKIEMVPFSLPCLSSGVISG